MSYDALRELAEKTYGADTFREMEGDLSMSLKGVRVVTADYVQLVYHNAKEFTARFTGPSGGPQTYLVDRAVQHEDIMTAPNRELMLDALTEKYGEPSTANQLPRGMALAWAFKDGIQVPCVMHGMTGPGPRCWVDDRGVSGRDAIKQVTDFDFLIHVVARSFRADSDKIQSYNVTIVDYKLRAETSAADTAALEAATEALLAASQGEMAKPSL